jgi:DNA polymerase-3 subunit epsilon/exodeoxyribonuclease X
MDLFDFDFTNEDNKKSKAIFFDTETTGNEKDDQIIEIGAIVEDIDGNFIKSFDELCATTDNKLIAPEAMATHGIRNEDLEGKEPFTKSSFYKELETLNIPSSYFIAHNLPFDLERLKFYGFNPRGKLIDTLQCAKHLYELGETLGKWEYALPNYKLQTFRYILFDKEEEIKEAAKFNIEIQAHSALSDVIILKMFFKELLGRVKAKYNLERKDAFEKLVELSSKPVLIKEFSFGKYKGKKLEDIAKQDRGYLEWLYNDMQKRKNSGESIDENIFGSLKYYLEA